MQLLTIVEALNNVAQRSFYEPCAVIPIHVPNPSFVNFPDIYYLVTDDISDIPEEWEWSYNSGITPHDGIETTRLMEPYVSFSSWDDIQHHFPDQVEALENDEVILHFRYEIVRNSDVEYDEDGNAIDPVTKELTDDTAGWILACQERPIA